jgi:hypothetical protein
MAADFKAMEVLDKNIGDGNGRRGRKLGRAEEKKFNVYSSLPSRNCIINFASIFRACRVQNC